MRSLVVFGRGGPRGPPSRPRYLLQPPPKLAYSIKSVLSGNPFEILATIPEKIQIELSSENHSKHNQTSVVHDKSKIPDSKLVPKTSKYSTLCSPAAPENNLGNLQDDTKDYTEVVRGRKKSQYFNKKIKQSKNFTQKLKESFHSKSMSFSPDSTIDTSVPLLNPPKEDLDSEQLSETMYISPMEMDDAPNDAQEEAPNAVDEFQLTPEDERALLDHDMSVPLQPPAQSSLQKSLNSHTVQPDIKRFFTSKSNVNIPRVPEPDKRAATNVEDFTTETDVPLTSTTPDVSAPPSISEQYEEKRKIPIRSVSRKEITCRFKIRIAGGTCNLPLLIKQVIKLYRGVDSSLSVLPIQNPSDDSLILDHEDLIPETEDELKQWVTCVVPHHERVHFTMRFALNKALSAISGPIFAWMKLNRSYVKMDSIRNEKIVTLGFFEGFHPDFQTRDTFKEYCYTHIMSKNTSLSSFTLEDFSVYPRAVYVGEAMEKVTTRAMVIEVGADHSSSVLSSLSSAFTDMYSDVTFVPFTKVDNDYQVLLKMAMLKQNTLLHSLKRKQIRGLINPYTLLEKKDGQQISLCQWLQSARNEFDPDTQIVKSVEKTKYNTSILYYGDNSDQVSNLCKDLKSNMSQHFLQSSIDKVFTDAYSPAPLNMSRIITDEETTWASIIKRKYLSNPHEDIVNATESPSAPPNKFRKSVYYGSTKKPSSLREDTHILENSPSSETETVSSFQSELSFRCNELEQKLQAFMHSQEKINTDTRIYVDNSIATMEENLNLQLQQNTDTIQHQISTLETNNNNQFSVIAQTLNSVAGNVNALLSNFNLINQNENSASTTITTKESVSDSGKY